MCSSSSVIEEGNGPSSSWSSLAIACITPPGYFPTGQWQLVNMLSVGLKATSSSQGSGKKLPDIGQWRTSALTSVACIVSELNSMNK